VRNLVILQWTKSKMKDKNLTYPHLKFFIPETIIRRNVAQMKKTLIIIASGTTPMPPFKFFGRGRLVTRLCLTLWIFTAYALMFRFDDIIFITLLVTLMTPCLWHV
jgi:hypothetical protein